MLVRATYHSIAREIAGAARIRHSLRPLIFEGDKFPAKLGRIVPRECGHTYSCRHPRRRVTQYSRDRSDKAEKPRRTGSPASAGDDSGGWGGAVRRHWVWE